MYYQAVIQKRLTMPDINSEATIGCEAPIAVDVRFATPEVILFSSDVERACAFYRRLGFQETFRVPEHGAPIHVDLSLDGYKIGFASFASARQRATITLWTDDTAHAYRTLTAAGIPGLAEPHTFLGRLLIAWVQDPDGHPIQLVQRFMDT